MSEVEQERAALLERAEAGDTGAMVELAERIPGDTLYEFLLEVGRFPAITDADAAALVERRRDGYPLAQQELVEGQLKLVVAVTKDHRGKGLLFLNLIAWGAVGAMCAAAKHDSRVRSFLTSANWWIEQAVLEALIASRAGTPLTFPADTEVMLERLEGHADGSGLLPMDPSGVAHEFMAIASRSEPLRMLCRSDELVAARRAEARQWLERAADLDDVQAVEELGKSALNAEDFDGAARWWERGAAMGSTTCMNRLGGLSERREDHESAVTWYEKSALLGDERAMYRMGELSHQRGDVTSAESWMRKAHDAGFGRATGALGVMLAVANRVDEARSLLAMAAAVGDPIAFRCLGEVAIEEGNDGVGWAWVKLAARRGDAAAMWLLGTAEAESGPAQLWYRRAAAAGSEEALEELARNPS